LINSDIFCTGIELLFLLTRNRKETKRNKTILFYFFLKKKEKRKKQEVASLEFFLPCSAIEAMASMNYVCAFEVYH
jgi:hypothetical protein